MRKPSRTSHNFGYGAIYWVRDTAGGTDLGTEDMFNFGQVESEECAGQTSGAVQKSRWNLGWQGEVGPFGLVSARGLWARTASRMLDYIICVYKSVSLY